MSGWIVEENAETGEDKWNLLGERNPQLPQLFQKVANQSLVLVSFCYDDKHLLKLCRGIRAYGQKVFKIMILL